MVTQLVVREDWQDTDLRRNTRRSGDMYDNSAWTRGVPEMMRAVSSYIIVLYFSREDVLNLNIRVIVTRSG
ncbi:hypothetical protein HanRHA438_Chr14g0635761 [Helianthus annuus]|nr:hypothetical protein HanPSC8_Chr14g0600551 [Helianthus annuus]KAJ0852232.1 hypothetical protein HanRHA438_Chr14g0635761 [Helianthus annuus]